MERSKRILALVVAAILLISTAVAAGWLLSSCNSKDDNGYENGGNGNGPEQREPISVNPMITPSEFHTLALHENGTLWTWGRNQFDQLGLGDLDVDGEDYLETPTQIEYGYIDEELVNFWDKHIHFTKIASRNHSFNLAIDNSGRLWSWGRAHGGCLGLDFSVDEYGVNNTIFQQRNRPTLIQQGHVDYRYSRLQYHEGVVDVTVEFTTVNFYEGPDAIRFVYIAAGQATSRAIDNRGRMWSWGHGHMNHLGLGWALDNNGEEIVGTSWNLNNAFLPTLIETSFDGKNLVEGEDAVEFVTTTIGLTMSTAVDSKGRLWVWSSSRGFGEAVAIPRVRPLMLTHGWDDSDPNGFELYEGEDAVTFVHAIGGEHLGVALDSNGKIWTWGLNGQGRLGLGVAVNQVRNRPVMIDTGYTTFTQISVLWNSVFALDTNGNIWSWVSNADGQLGLGDTVQRLSPTMIDVADTTFTYISFGWFSMFAIDSDNNVWSWGRNNFGQLGLGHQDNVNVPTLIEGFHLHIEIPSDDEDDYNNGCENGKKEDDEGDDGE